MKIKQCYLGFNITVATIADTPPTACTGPQPALSTTPHLLINPLSSQNQCSGKTYDKKLRNENNI